MQLSCHLPCSRYSHWVVSLAPYSRIISCRSRFHPSRARKSPPTSTAIVLPRTTERHIAVDGRASPRAEPRYLHAASRRSYGDQPSCPHTRPAQGHRERNRSGARELENDSECWDIESAFRQANHSATAKR